MRPALWLLGGLLLAAGGTLASAQAPAQTPAPPPAPPKNLQVLPKDSTRAQVVERMRAIATGLGVKCSFCHAAGGFDKDDLDTKLIARRMLRMVDAINRDNFSSRPEVSCYTCHRGQPHPLNQPPAKPASGGH